jgi:hypothetical protein
VSRAASSCSSSACEGEFFFDIVSKKNTGGREQPLTRLTIGGVPLLRSVVGWPAEPGSRSREMSKLSDKMAKELAEHWINQAKEKIAEIEVRLKEISRDIADLFERTGELEGLVDHLQRMKE